MTGKIINKIPHLLMPHPVPIAALIKVYGRMSLFEFVHMPPQRVVIVPPLTEAQAMETALADCREHGLPEYVVPLAGEDERWEE